MASAIGDMVARLRLDSSGFTRGSRNAQREMGRFRKSAGSALVPLTKMGSILGVGFGAAAFVGGIRRAAMASNQFQGSMNRSLAIMSGVTAEMREEMADAAHVMAAETQFSSDQVAKSYFYLASAGMDAKESVAELGTVTKFAQAGNFDLALATDLATDSASALGKEMDELSDVTNVLVGANTLANASVQQFAEAITNQAGAKMRQYNIPMEEGVAALAAFADQGIKGKDAGTKLGIVIRDLTSKAITNRDAFEDLNVSVFKQGEWAGIANIVGELEDALGGLTSEGQKAALMQLGFTAKNIAATQALLGYSDEIRNWTGELEGMGNVVDRIANESLTDFDKAWNRLSGNMAKTRDDVLPPVVDHLAKMIEAVNMLATGEIMTPEHMKAQLAVIRQQPVVEGDSLSEGQDWIRRNRILQSKIDRRQAPERREREAISQQAALGGGASFMEWEARRQARAGEPIRGPSPEEIARREAAKEAADQQDKEREEQRKQYEQFESRRSPERQLESALGKIRELESAPGADADWNFLSEQANKEFQRYAQQIGRPLEEITPAVREAIDTAYAQYEGPRPGEGGLSLEDLRKFYGELITAAESAAPSEGAGGPEFMKTEPRLAGAAEKGSREATSIIARSQAKPGVQRVEKDQLATQRSIDEGIKTMVQNQENETTFSINAL